MIMELHFQVLVDYFFFEFECLFWFGPLPAVFFCVAACMGLRWLWIPLLAWVLSYQLTNLIQGGYSWDWQMLIVIGGFGFAVALGYSLRNKQ